MSNNQNWPDRVYAYTRNWGRADTAGRFMGFINVELSRKEDLPPNFPAVEYISAEKVREIQLATVTKTIETVCTMLEASMPPENFIWDVVDKIRKMKVEP